MAGRLSAKSLKVTAPGIAAAGASIKVKVGGLKRGETVTITIDDVTLATGKAPWIFAATVTVPLGSTAVGSKTVVATGSSADRTGSCPITIAKDGGAAHLTKRI